MITRRNFIKSSIGVGAALGIGACNIVGSNDNIRIGIIGLRSKGNQHLSEFSKISNVHVVALCDVDSQILAQRKKEQLEKFPNQPIDTYSDARELLDRKDIDAVVIATPNHTHSILAIWAIQAGKDVYVEKPISHNVWEGRQVVKAARQRNRIVQSGTQNRSDVGIRAAVDYINQGNIGAIQYVHGLWYKSRKPIGKVDGPTPIPKHINYDLWCGPSPLKPLMRENLHYDWHWDWDTGNGDFGNLGVHQIDDCRFFLGNPGMPEKVVSFGERFAWDDDGITPNTHFGLLEFKDAPPMYIEVRNLPMAKSVNAMDHLRGVRMGNIIQCEDGFFAGGRGGGWIYGNDKKKIKQFPGDGGGLHQSNFIDAVRARNTEMLHADIEQGHLSSAYCHLANISYRIGEHASIKNVSGAVTHDSYAVEAVERIEKHLLANEINLKKTPIILGASLNVDTVAEKFLGEKSEAANTFLKRKEYREPFKIA